MQQRLYNAFPFCSDLNQRSEDGFIPHLSLGQWQNEKEMTKKQEQFLQGWQQLTYTVDSVFLISRTGEDPFDTRYQVKFDGQIIPLNVTEEKCAFMIATLTVSILGNMDCYSHVPPTLRSNLESLCVNYLLEILH